MVAIPRLPMPEVDIPRSLDAAAEVLLASGRTDEAAYALGRALATELPVDTVLPRTSVLEETRDRIVERLGADRAAALMARGERAAPDEALDTITGWLAEE